MMRPKDLRQGSGTKTFLDAMHEGKVHLARFVLDALDGRIINSKTENNRTPLMFAVCLPEPTARAKFTQLLLEKGADVNCQDENGRSALSLACELGHLDAVKLLVQFNADPDVSDAWGNSALVYAAYAGHSQVLEFLVKAFKRLGLKLDRTNNAGHSAIQVAHFFGHNHCVQALNISGRKCVMMGSEISVSEAVENRRQPNKLSWQVLERFSKPLYSEDKLPGVFQRQLKVGDSNRLWSRFRCHDQPRGDSSCSPPDHQRAQTEDSSCSPPDHQRAQTEDSTNVMFTAKQLQNNKLGDLRGVKTLNHFPDPRQKDQQAQESFPLWGKAKSFNLDVLSSRKQSYQGDLGDMRFSASKFKRASLQDERFLIAKIECREKTGAMTSDADKPVTARGFLNGKSPSQRAAAEENTRSEEDEQTDTVQSSRRASQKRDSLLNRKLLFNRGDTDQDKIHICPPGSSGLGTRLLRRFTAPEFMRMVLDCSSGSAHGRVRMSRSETFPLSHQTVNSQPSVDSISGVKCEFESSHSKVTLD